MVRLAPLCLLLLASPLFAHWDPVNPTFPWAAFGQTPFAPPTVNDAYATEGIEHWEHRFAPDLAPTPDAKVGKVSICGTLSFTHHIVLPAGAGRAWNLTGYEKLRFWAKADKPTSNLLVMLLTRDFQNRRDTAVSVRSDWTLCELPLEAATFNKNVSGDSAFTRVRALVFYNNQAGDLKLWLDGLEFVGPRPPQADTASFVPTGNVRVVDLLPTDPSPHLAEAEAARHVAVPRYDLPPQAFNRENSFAEALVNFDAARGWKAYLQDCSGTLSLSTDQSLRGCPNLKLELTGLGPKPRVVLMAPQPIPVPRAFDLIECWVYGGHHGTGISFLFQQADGSPLATGTDFSQTADDVNPKPVGEFWNIARVVLPGKVPAGAALVGIELRPNVPRADDDRPVILHLDQLRVQDLQETLKAPRPQFPHVGKIVANFPTRPDGACPTTTESVATSLRRVGDAYLFTYRNPKGETVAYRYAPQTGTLSDLEVVTGAGSFRPASGSGPVFDFAGRTLDANALGEGRTELVSVKASGSTLTAVWRYGLGEAAETIRYEFALKGKTLRVGASSTERNLSEWKFGVAKGVKNARVIEMPFMLYSPNVLLTHGLFVTYYADWYRGNVSMLPYGGETEVKGDEASYNWRRDHQYAYTKLTDGRRQPFREVFYLTASRNVEEVLLTVSNPPSPMRDVMKKRLYRMVLAGVPGIFQRARAFADLAADYGVTDYYFLFHAPLFFRRYGGSEAFPGDEHVSMLHEPEGGDAGLQQLFAHLRRLGVRPGYYDGYPARDVTGPNFHYDWTALQPDGQWNTMWRCPALKPWAFPELAATVVRDRARRYGAGVSYQDGITSWIISSMSEYDHRWPENGLLRETLKALATGWQRCRENVSGPVFSEGRGSDFYHAGLNDGDYSKLKGYWDEQPCTEDRVQLLLDFRLRKLGPLSAPVSLNIGYAGFAGTNKIHYETFYAGEESWRHLHQFLATQIAFATTGMLEPYWPIWEDPHTQFDKTLTSFFMVRALQERYLMEPVRDIQYFDGTRLLSTSDALRADVVQQNRVRVTYRNGLAVWINLNWDGQNWSVRQGGETYELPPGGWLATQGTDFLEYSMLQDGRRVDFVDCPDYVYVHGHGRPTASGPREATHQVIRWKRGPKAGQTLLYPPS